MHQSGMRRAEELAAIDRWLAEHGGHRARTAYAGTVAAALPPGEEKARLAALPIPPTFSFSEWNAALQRAQWHRHG